MKKINLILLFLFAIVSFGFSQNSYLGEVQNLQVQTNSVVQEETIEELESSRETKQVFELSQSAKDLYQKRFSTECCTEVSHTAVNNWKSIVRKGAKTLDLTVLDEIKKHIIELKKAL